MQSLTSGSGNSDHHPLGPQFFQDEPWRGTYSKLHVIPNLNKVPKWEGGKMEGVGAMESGFLPSLSSQEAAVAIHSSRFGVLHSLYLGTGRQPG